MRFGVTIFATDPIAVEGQFCLSNWWWTSSGTATGWTTNSPGWRTNFCETNIATGHAPFRLLALSNVDSDRASAFDPRAATTLLGSVADLEEHAVRADESSSREAEFRIGATTQAIRAANRAG